MTQRDTVGPVENAVGYVLKEAAVALRNAMDAVLRPLNLTVPQYACLELLGQRPGLSNAELARGAFVTRQSMNVVLHGLEARGLVTRPAIAPRGRELPAALTQAGRDHLHAASAAVRDIEEKMCAGLAGNP
jgi:DNA-binding MarR family transcriptional regulator